MADIELVIKMSEEYYKGIEDEAKEFLFRGMKVPSLYEIVIKGTPLPKGHGKLIDESEISLSEIHFKTELDHAKMIGRLNSAPTIIEADKDNSND